MDITRETVNDWLDKRRSDRKWLADQCGVSEVNVGHWLNKKGKARPIPGDHQITIRHLMEEDKEAEAMNEPQLSHLVLHITTDELNDWIEAYKDSGKSEKVKNFEDWTIKTIRDYIRTEKEKENRAEESSEAGDNVIAFPEITLLHAAAGPAISTDGETYAPSRALGKGRFAVQLHGDSMAPKYPDGSIVILRERASLKNQTLKKGEIYLFDIENEKTLKIYNSRPATPEEIESGISYTSKEDGKQKVRILRSINKDVPEIVVDGPVEWLGWLDKKDQ